MSRWEPTRRRRIDDRSRTPPVPSRPARTQSRAALNPEYNPGTPPPVSPPSFTAPSTTRSSGASCRRWSSEALRGAAWAPSAVRSGTRASKQPTEAVRATGRRRAGRARARGRIPRRSWGPPRRSDRALSGSETGSRASDCRPTAEWRRSSRRTTSATSWDGAGGSPLRRSRTRRGVPS